MALLICCFVDDNDGSFSFFQGKTADFFLDEAEIFWLAERSLSIQFHCEISIKVTDGNCGKNVINDFIKGRIELCRPVTIAGVTVLTGGSNIPVLIDAPTATAQTPGTTATPGPAPWRS